MRRGLRQIGGTPATLGRRRFGNAERNAMHGRAATTGADNMRPGLREWLIGVAVVAGMRRAVGLTRLHVALVGAGRALLFHLAEFPLALALRPGKFEVHGHEASIERSFSL